MLILNPPIERVVSSALMRLVNDRAQETDLGPEDMGRFGQDRSLTLPYSGRSKLGKRNCQRRLGALEANSVCHAPIALRAKV